jgi:pectate lyase-like protein/parallel beta helix pectate lyase-like protein
MRNADASVPPAVARDRVSRRHVLGAGALTAGAAMAPALLRPDDAAASTITGYYNVKDSPYNATGDGSTNDTAAIQAALNAAGSAGGGVVYFPPGTYRVSGSDGTGFLTVPDKVRVVGAGIRSTKVKGPENWNGASYIFLATGENTEFEDLTIEMPDAFTAADNKYLRGIQLDDSAETVYVRRVYFHNLTYGVTGWINVVQTIECVDCLFTGEGVTGTGVSPQFDAMGIMYEGPALGQVIVRGCEFRSLGSSRSPNHVHSIYVSHPTALLVEDSRFFDQVDGRYIQWYSTDQTGSALYAMIVGCVFGAQRSGHTNTGVHTCPTVPTIVASCEFATQQKSIDIKGPCTISDCIFTGDGGGSSYQVEIGDGTTSATILMESCRFHSNNLVDVFIGQGNIDLVLKDCRFPSTSSEHVHLQDTGTRNLNVDGCSFHSQQIDPAAIVIQHGDLVEISNNLFRNSGQAVLIDTGASVTRLRVSNNDFSQPGNSLNFVSTPTSFSADGNFGSKGYLSANGGTVTVADGGTITHGLGSTAAPITPSSFSLEPRVAQRVTSVTAVSSTTLTISLRNNQNAGAAITTAEQVTWWARQ